MIIRQCNLPTIRGFFTIASSPARPLLVLLIYLVPPLQYLPEELDELVVFLQAAELLPDVIIERAGVRQVGLILVKKEGDRRGLLGAGGCYEGYLGKQPRQPKKHHALPDSFAQIYIEKN